MCSCDMDAQGDVGCHACVTHDICIVEPDCRRCSVCVCLSQVTKNGIVHLAFHPCTDTLILAAADKSGHVGLWSVDADLARPSGSATKENEGQNHENAGQAEGQQQSVKGDKSGVLLLLLFNHCCLVPFLLCLCEGLCLLLPSLCCSALRGRHSAAD